MGSGRITGSLPALLPPLATPAMRRQAAPAHARSPSPCQAPSSHHRARRAAAIRHSPANARQARRQPAALDHLNPPGFLRSAHCLQRHMRRPFAVMRVLPPSAGRCLSQERQCRVPVCSVTAARRRAFSFHDIRAAPRETRPCGRSPETTGSPATGGPPPAASRGRRRVYRWISLRVVRCARRHPRRQSPANTW